MTLDKANQQNEKSPSNGTGIRDPLIPTINIPTKLVNLMLQYKYRGPD